MKAHEGTRARYLEGCRCGPCTEANRVYQRGYFHTPKRQEAVHRYEAQEHVLERRRLANRRDRARRRESST